MIEARNPNPPRAWPRRLFGALGLLLVLLAGSPVWFPWLLVFVARHNGVKIADYDRVGVTRLRLADVEATLGGQLFRASTLEMPQPLTWLTSVARSAGSTTTTPTWLLRDWSLRPDAETDTAAAPSAFDSIPAVLEQVEGAATHGSWLGGAIVAEAGQIDVAGHNLQVTTLRVSDRGITASLVESGTRLDLNLTLAAAGRYEARATLNPGDLLLESTATRTGLSWNLAGSLFQQTNRMNFEAVTRPGGWLPASARIDGDAWTLPLPQGFHGSVQVRGQADWNEGLGSFGFGLSGALSLPNDPSPLPISATLTGRLTPEAVTLETLLGDWSFARVSLRGPVRWSFQDLRMLSPVALDFQANPGAVPRWGVSGTASGTLQSREGEFSGLGQGLSFSLTGSALAARGVVFERLVANGSIDWPWIRVAELEAASTTGMSLAASGTADVHGTELRQVAWKLEGRIPEIPTFGTFVWPALHASGTAHGPFTNLLQTGEVRSLADVTLGPLKPLSLDAHWRARGLALEQFTLNATQGTAGLHLQGHATYQALPSPSLRGEWAQLDFVTAGQPDLALTQPFAFSFESSGASNLAVRLAQGNWKGTAGELQASAEIEWPGKGRFNATAHDLTAGFLSAWSQDIPPWITHTAVHDLASEGSWNEGPLEARTSIDITVPLPEVGPVRMAGSVVAGADGVRFDDWTFTRDGAAGPHFSARLPMKVHPSRGPREAWEWTDGPIQGALTLGKDAWPWRWIASRTGAEFTEPAARIELGGTLADPILQLVWNAPKARIQIPQREASSILLGAIAGRAHVSSRQIVLDSLTLGVEGQTLTAQASIPWQPAITNNAATWSSRWMPDLERAQGHIDLPGASISALAKPLEDYLQPGGTLRGRIERRDAAWHGWLELTNVTTRPIPALGILRDIDLRVVWADDKLQIERGQALLGGQPLSVSGAWTLPNHPKPEASLRLSATNLALVRSTELILRADLDLTLGLNRTNPLAPPVVGGLVTLHDSVVTMDVRDLVAVDLERPRQRPPFFTVEQPWLADWTLDVQVRGDRFARILSPILRASASADLNLLGTLGQPRLLGQALVDRGRLSFPFGQLEIQQFRVVFTEADPYRPRLEGKAEGMSFGYALGMELAGTLAEPGISFTSTPPMTTSEVLQMLMAGSLPRNEYSYSKGDKARNVGTYLAGDLLTQLAGDPMEEPRLTFRSAQRVSASGNLTYAVEYRLTDRWSAVAEYDRWNQLGAGVRWRILEK